MLNYSFVPQKVVEKTPVYFSKPYCPLCMSNNVYPIMNMVGSPLKCTKCNNIFDQQKIGYKNVLVEK